MKTFYFVWSDGGETVLGIFSTRTKAFEAIKNNGGRWTLGFIILDKEYEGGYFSEPN